MRYLIINTKNYLETVGPGMDAFLRAVNVATSTRSSTKSTVCVSLPAFYVAYASARIPRLKLLAQHLDPTAPGSTTGFLIPEIAKTCGAFGSLINHSEHRIEESQVAELVRRLGKLKMKSFVCARDEDEVRKFALLSPDFLAIEPPELIGSGNAVSKARPEVIVNSKRALEESRPANSKTRLLCGAGIVEELDAKIAVELGAEGVLVASGVVKSKNWESKISSLMRGISDAKRK
jgi:triosephosphate isomerase (TIM)